MKGLVIPLLFAASISHAGTYRWVDENGQTHFGDRPPTNAVTNEVRLESAQPPIDTKAHERKQRVNEFLQQTEKERAARKDAEARQEAQAAKLRDHCARMEARLKHLNNVSGIYRLNKDGERVFVNDEENERIREEFRARVHSECNS
ncbi:MULTISPECIES: DUF4124 domain-containing protein [Marinobacter]|uniref:DUF4124 domain-containing protein n=1 Tax=Marinobacter TaxID=2742 RepID=UPI0028126D7A|nr:DUF4124 domain-containing protein [Marinobacter sp. F26243]